MIVLLGYIHLDPSDVNAFIADVRTITPGTKAEMGCLFYSVTVDDASAGRVLVVERWQDQESLAPHLESLETTAFLKRWTGRMRSDVLKYDVSNARPLMGS